jgi:glycerol-3-phosphate dehydrogenase (NAD(P)+)
MPHFAVLGAGAWGTALARVLAGHATKVTLWTWQPEHARTMAERRENLEFFPGFHLPEAIVPTADVEEALDQAKLVILALPSHVMRQNLERMASAFLRDAIIVNATKGIENDTLMLMSDVIVDVFGPRVRPYVTVLSGPSFAKEVAQGMPTNVVVAASQREIGETVQRHLATDRLRVYTSDDLVGVQLGGALKNVIAIAAGACDGLGFGNNSRAALITRGIAEITRLSVRAGANPLTISGLTGVGDLILTCTGELSRNRTVGLELGRGRDLRQVLADLGHVAEGVPTAKSAYQLATKLQVELPITTEVYRVLFENKPPQLAVRDLIGRPLRHELD